MFRMRQDLVSEILALPAAERRRLVETIWDSIAAEPEASRLTDWQKEELDLRLADLEADPDSGATPEEVFERIRRTL
jgi:putative addiction module component (TIGR02574 family)